ncbi:hypothetical protein KC865_03070 [Candidatus Kaiserbacteria bacterium]|nr:hypothetical protein [Candidatus Kaiserbacteria bacterium]USN91927.1 MAG: hypothetical protein H6782_03565 [Candidatus Nomurabacteria bacterium]
MTAFNEVLTAEEEAEKLISVTKEETEEAVSVARQERQKRLEAEKTRLAELEKSILDSHESVTKKATVDIESGVKDQINVVKQRFDAKKSTLKTIVKQSLS